MDVIDGKMAEVDFTNERVRDAQSHTPIRENSKRINASQVIRVQSLCTLNNGVI